MATTSDMLRDVAHHHGWRWQSVVANEGKVRTDYFSQDMASVTVHYDRLGRIGVVDCHRPGHSSIHLAKTDSNKTEQVVEWLTA